MTKPKNLLKVSKAFYRIYSIIALLHLCFYSFYPLYSFYSSLSPPIISRSNPPRNKCPPMLPNQ